MRSNFQTIYCDFQNEVLDGFWDNLIFLKKFKYIVGYDEIGLVKYYKACLFDNFIIPTLVNQTQIINILYFHKYK